MGLSLDRPKMLKPVAVRGAYESRKRQTCVVPANVSVVDVANESCQLTSWCRGFGIREQHHAALALFYKLRECCLLSVVCLDLSTEAAKVDCVANLGWSRRGSSSSSSSFWLALSGLAVAIGSVSHSFLCRLDSVCHSLGDDGGSFGDSFGGLLDHGLPLSGLLALGRRRFLSWAHRRWRGCLAFAKLDHGECITAQLGCGRVSMLICYQCVDDGCYARVWKSRRSASI